MQSTYKSACLYVCNNLCTTECTLVNYDFTLTAVNWQIKIWLKQDQYNVSTYIHFWAHLEQYLISTYCNKTCNVQKLQRKMKGTMILHNSVSPMVSGIIKKAVLCYASFLTCVHSTAFSMPQLGNCLSSHIADWQGKQSYHSQK